MAAPFPIGSRRKGLWERSTTFLSRTHFAEAKPDVPLELRAFPAVILHPGSSNWIHFPLLFGVFFFFFFSQLLRRACWMRSEKAASFRRNEGFWKNKSKTFLFGTDNVLRDDGKIEIREKDDTRFQVEVESVLRPRQGRRGPQTRQN